MRMILAVIVALVIGVGPHWQKYKAEKIAAYQAQHGAYYLQDRGYSVKLMGKALVVDKPDPADLALVMTTYRAFTVDLAEGDTCA